jgi:hypothetical protein
MTDPKWRIEIAARPVAEAIAELLEHRRRSAADLRELEAAGNLKTAAALRESDRRCE